MGLPFNGSTKLNEGLIAYFALDDDRPSEGIMDSKYEFNAYRNNNDNSEDKSVTGLNGKAQSFDRASSDGIIISGGLGEHLRIGVPFTISCIVNLDILQNYNGILGNDYLDGHGFGIYGQSNGNLLAIFREVATGATLYAQIGVAPFMVANRDYHVLVTYNGGLASADIRMYIDSVVVTYGSASGTPTASALTDFYIGGEEFTAVGGHMTGSVQHVGIWDHVLDSTARDQLWDDGNILTYGKKPVTRGFNDYPSLGHKLIGEWGLDDNEASTITADSLKRLDGTLNTNSNALYDSMAPAELAGGYDWSKSASKRITLEEFIYNHIGLGQKLTIEVWTYGNDATNDRYYFGNSTSSSTRGISFITPNGAGGNSALFSVSSGLDASTEYIYSSEILNASAWNQIVLVFNGTSTLADVMAGVELYVNKVSNNATGGITQTGDFNPPECFIGYTGSYDDTYKQSMVRFHSRELNQNEVTYLYNSGLGRKRLPHFEGHTELCEGLISSWDLRDDQPTPAVVDQVGNVDGVCTANTDVLSVSGGMLGRNMMDFNISNDYIDIDAIKSYIGWGKPFSIEMWFLNDPAANGYLFGNSPTFTYGAGIMIRVVGDACYAYCSDGVDGHGARYSSNTFTTGLSHLVVTYDGNSDPDGWFTGAKIYVNTAEGALTTGKVGVQDDFAPLVMLMARGYGALYSKIPQSITRFWNRALSQIDVNNLNNNMNGLEY